MDLYAEIYEFAASVGALEGYVFSRKELDPNGLDNWIRNIVKQYHELPEAARNSFQAGLDRTVGRAIHSMVPLLGQTHLHVTALTSLVKGQMPKSAEDFEKEKKEKAEPDGAAVSI